MTRTLAVVLAMTFSAAPVFAEGDIEAGEKAFNKCKSCHQIVSDAGDEIVKGGRTGPNLYGVLGRQAGTTDFRYGDDLVAAGEAGLVWDAANFAEYVQDPRAFLRTYLDDSKAKSKMAYKLRSGGEDIAAYLASVTGSSS
ncbi:MULTISPECIES: c-type cytochrome [Roseobacter]|uniref:Cytochrome c-551 (Precursor) n=1 Tax=Roseobacter litoralis (strain ATCC 49566 / DSM 6996 / JCM 21268 / NBRC 15278 / OCh 149) TaxID=391595 RepID=F7ZM92_ROSLO|nr:MULTISPECIES: c-type cytochrome [Roseobacter]AEI96429.1 cytochrome c-551 (precursor) [Roseobacter litoralis Och 149]GIT89058.1 cytochrome c2 [Roseobacter sp. OBYS 0001]